MAPESLTSIDENPNLRTPSKDPLSHIEDRPPELVSSRFPRHVVLAIVKAWREKNECQMLG